MVAQARTETLMKPIQKDELYQHLRGFLKNKGIEFKEGSYTKGIHAACSLLADAINLSQRGIERARTEIDKNVDRVRQVIHEKTAPKASQRAPNARPPAQPPPILDAARPKSKAARSMSRRSRAKGRKR